MLLLTGGKEGKASDSVNAAMLEAGMARLPAKARSRGAGVPGVHTALRAAQDVALSEHVGLFRYGDPGDSDDE